MRPVAQEPLGLERREHLVAHQALGQVDRVEGIVALHDLALDLGELALAEHAGAADHREQIERHALRRLRLSRSSPWRASPDSLDDGTGEVQCARETDLIVRDATKNSAILTRVAPTIVTYDVATSNRDPQLEHRRHARCEYSYEFMPVQSTLRPTRVDHRLRPVRFWTMTRSDGDH